MSDALGGLITLLVYEHFGAVIKYEGLSKCGFSSQITFFLKITSLQEMALIFKEIFSHLFPKGTYQEC